MRPALLVFASLLAATAMNRPAEACSAIWIQTVTVSAPDAPECLAFSVANDPEANPGEMNRDVIVTVANSCETEARITCTNSCGDWTEPTTVAAGASAALGLTGAGTMEWDQDGTIGAVDVNTDGTWSDCPGPFAPVGCSGAGPGQSAPIAGALMVLWGLVVVRRRRVSGSLPACTR